MFNVDFVGRLGADAEVKTSKNGNQFVTMRVATDDFYRGENHTDWVNVMIMQERLGNRKMNKGSLVSVHGVLRTSAYQSKSGEAAVSLECTADRIEYVNVSSGSTANATVETKAAEDTGKFTKKGTKNAEAAAENTASTEPDDLPF